MASQLVVSNLTGSIVGPVSLSVAAGTCAAICGPSGAGKSLLLRMIADLVPSTGEVRLGDRARADIAAPLWRADVMYVGGTGWWASTVAAHVPEARRPDAATWIARLGMKADYLDRAVATLSTGEAQRLALVRALVRAPKVLLLDEPTSALDATAVGRVEELLRDALRSGTIILLVTHEPAHAQRLADARYTMSAGRLSAA